MIEGISPALQLIVAGGLPPPDMTSAEAMAKRMETESKVSRKVYGELALMVGEKLRQAQHALVDAEHGHTPMLRVEAEELSMRVDIPRNLRDLYQLKACS